MDHYGALCKIMKHLLTTPAKFSKCLSMVHELVRESFDFLTTFFVEGGEDCVTSGNVLFNMFDAVMRVEGKFRAREDRETIEKLYLFLIELSENEEELFSELQEKVLDLLYIPVYVQSSLVTDDSFKVIARFNKHFSSMSSRERPWRCLRPLTRSTKLTRMCTLSYARRST